MFRTLLLALAVALTSPLFAADPPVPVPELKPIILEKPVEPPVDEVIIRSGRPTGLERLTLSMPEITKAGGMIMGSVAGQLPISVELSRGFGLGLGGFGRGLGGFGGGLAGGGRGVGGGGGARGERGGFNPGGAFIPGGGLRGAARLDPAPVAADNDLRRKYEEQLKQFEESIKNASDAEAKQEFEKARDEYKKTMEGPLKKADAEAPARPQPQARPNPFGGGGAFPNPFPGQNLPEDELIKELGALNRQLLKQLTEDLKRVNPRFDPNNPGAIPFPMAGPKELEALLEELLDPNARPGGNPFGGLPGQRAQAPPRLGVRVEKVPAVLVEQLDLPKDGGLVVVEVLPGTPAEKAGLKANDIILKLGDADVPTDPAAFTALVGKLKGGEKLDAVIVRKGKKETIKGIELADDKRPGRIGAAQNERVQFQINGDDIATLTATVDGVGYTVVGPFKNGKLDPARIVITEGGESKEYDSLEKVPEGQRATAERLLGRGRLLSR